MRKEETTERLKMILAEATSHEDAVCYATSDDADALEIAIKALEQEPCEDCISRQEIIYELNRLGRNAFKDDTDYDNFFAFVDSLSSVTPQAKTGHLILTDVEGDRVWQCNCSECGKDPQNYVGGSENWWLIKNNLPKFCPSCGAKMTKESEVTE